MKSFTNDNRPYTAPADLNVVSKSYDTLQQGHQEAIQKAGDLETAMAQLDLNPAEDSFRADKLNEIKKTISDNSLYGNNYSALGDIIKKAADISSDPAMLGRLNAQRDYKTYIANVNAKNDLPQVYKDFYTSVNPYYYKDIKDSKGNVIGGTKWNPTLNPTQVVPLDKLLSQGLQWAAKESGGGNVTRWLDQSGNITNDPTKAFDGEVLNTTTNQWERLSKTKIWQGVQAAIESTPGAKESLNQDYEVAYWNHGKNVVANGNKPVQDDITDKRGVILTPSQYLAKRVNPLLNAASYYNSVSITSYGQGLATYKAAQVKLQQQAQAEQMMFNNDISSRNTPVQIQQDAGTNFMTQKGEYSGTISNLYKQLTGKSLYIDSNNGIGNIKQLLDKHSVPMNQRSEIYSAVNLYNESHKNLEAFVSKMPAKDRAQYLDACQLKSGMAPTHGSDIANSTTRFINSAFGKSNTFNMTFTNDAVKKAFMDYINASGDNGKSLGINWNGDTVSIDKSHMYALPMVISAARTAQKARGFWGSLADKFSASDNGIKSGQLYNINNAPIPTGDTLFGSIKVKNPYDDVDNVIKTKLNSSGLPTTTTLSSINFGTNSFGERQFQHAYNKGLIDEKQYNTLVKINNEQLNNALRNTDFSQSDMYMTNDKTGIRNRVVNSGDRYNEGQKIVEALRTKKATITPTIVAGHSDAYGAPIAGYNINVIDDSDKKNPKTVSYYLPNLIVEGVSKDMLRDTKIRAANTVMSTGSNRSTRLLTDPNLNPGIGNTSISGIGNNHYQVSYKNVKSVVPQEHAVEFVNAINQYNDVKNSFIHGNEPTLGDRRNAVLKQSAISIGSILNINPVGVYNDFVKDLQSR